MNEQTENQKKETIVSDDEAASLAAIRAQVKVEEGELASQVESETDQKPAAPTLATEIGALVTMFVSMAKPILPSLGAIYTPETTNAVSEAVAAVCIKHGWLQDGIAKGYGEEVAAAAILLPIGFATYQGVRADIAAMKPKKETIPPTAADAFVGAPSEASSKTLVVGVPIVE